MTIHSGTHEVSRSGQYRAFAHFSRHVRRNAVVISSQGGAPGLDHVAVANPEGSYALVLTNSQDSTQDVVVRLGTVSTQVSAPPDSIVTLNWKAA